MSCSHSPRCFKGSSGVGAAVCNISRCSRQTKAPRCSFYGDPDVHFGQLSSREALYSMASLEKLARFARKPLHDKWAATKATIGELRKELQVALMHFRAAQIEFN